MKTTGIQVGFIRFIPFGALISTGPDVTATAAVAPNNDDLISADAQLWQEIGDISVSSDNPVIGQGIDILKRKPFSSQMQRVRQVNLGPVSREITFTCLTQNNVTVQLAALSTAINDASTTVGQVTEYTPFSNGANAIEGWFQLAYIDEDDAVVRQELHRGELRLAQPVQGSPTAQFTPSFILRVFPDDEATGSLLKKTS